jgi:hypothetical protein
MTEPVAVLILGILISINAQKSYKITSVVSQLTLLENCGVSVSEIISYDFNGTYSNAFRSIQDDYTSTGYPPVITNFNVTALTNNVQVLNFTLERSFIATHLYVRFSSALGIIGPTQFMFNYTLNNFMDSSASRDYNTMYWNYKWDSSSVSVPYMLMSLNIPPVYAKNLSPTLDFTVIPTPVAFTSSNVSLRNAVCLPVTRCK